MHFDFTGFENRQFIVKCNDKYESKSFLQFMQDAYWIWRAGQSLTSINYDHKGFPIYYYGSEYRRISCRNLEVLQTDIENNKPIFDWSKMTFLQSIDTTDLLEVLQA